MKITHTSFALLAIASVNAACDCVGTDSEGFPPASFFTSRGYVADLGTVCLNWDEDKDYCKVGSESYISLLEDDEDWCTTSWCYVPADNTCDPAAKDSEWFVGTEYDLKWITCEPESSILLGVILVILLGGGGGAAAYYFMNMAPAAA